LTAVPIQVCGVEKNRSSYRLINEKVIIDLVGTSNISLRIILPKKKSEKTLIILEKNVEKLSFPQIVHIKQGCFWAIQ